MVNASLLFQEKANQLGIVPETGFNLIDIVTYFSHIVSYFYREWSIKYSEIISWKIGTFLWHLSLMMEEIQVRKEHGNY